MTTYLLHANRSILAPNDVFLAKANVEHDIAAIAVKRVSQNLIATKNKLKSPLQPVADEQISVSDPNIIEQPPGRYVPFHFLKTNEKNVEQLFMARERLTSACMHERGFNYVPNEYEYEPPPPIEGVGDAAVASTDGYGLALSTMDYDSSNSDAASKFVQGLMSPVENKTSNDAFLDTLSSDQQQAWNNALLGNGDTDSTTRVSVESVAGSPVISWDSASCAAIARGQLHGDNVKQVQNMFALQALQREAFSTAETDIEYQTTLAQWRNCMSGYGYDFKYPGAAADILLSKYRNGHLQFEELQEQEISIATVDSTCYQQSAVGESFDNALKSAESVLLVERSDTITRLERARQKAVSRANAEIAFSDKESGNN
ncbi:hypothetical protein N9383_06550 [Granulosicoccus sp.]|nr:hypothetical protein [Granulosicoccus sp.]